MAPVLRLVHSLNFWSAKGNLFMRTSIPVQTVFGNLQNQSSPATPLQGIAEELSLAGLPGCMGTLCRSVATGRDLENSVAAT